MNSRTPDAAPVIGPPRVAASAVEAVTEGCPLWCWPLAGGRVTLFYGPHVGECNQDQVMTGRCLPCTSNSAALPRFPRPCSF
jgi:hypothetical protein